MNLGVQIVSFCVMLTLAFVYFTNKHHQAVIYKNLYAVSERIAYIQLYGSFHDIYAVQY